MNVIPISAGPLRALKHALQDRFPAVHSSHLSEAISAGFGFRTHAALLTRMKSSPLEPNIATFDEPSFIARLTKFGYPIAQSIAPGELRALALGTGVLNEFRANISRLLTLEVNPNVHWDEIETLRRRCSTLFARAFGLGYAEPRDDDKSVAHRISCGIDYKACSKGWGRATNAQRPRINFPGADHQLRFYERLSLSNGKFVEYTTAIVSMPYTGADGVVRDLPKARELAQCIGWTCIELKDWTWYAAKATTLVLFQRTTSHKEMEQAWATSFKRWLIENRSRLSSVSSAAGRKVIPDVIDCQHFPLDVKSYEDCRERYLKEFSAHLYNDESDPMAKALKKLFETWQAELALAKIDVAFGLTADATTAASLVSIEVSPDASPLHNFDLPADGNG